MKLIVAVDNRLGMLFNKRRQSMDRVLRERVYELTKGHRLLMNAYSAKQFIEGYENIVIDEEFLDHANEDDFCFVENIELSKHEDKIDTIYLFKWNRDYPGDHFLDINLSNYKLISSEDFEGYSHEKISLLEYKSIRIGIPKEPGKELVK